MLNLSRSSFAPQALTLNPATAARLNAPDGRAAYLQLRTLAPQRSWRALHLFPDGEEGALFCGALHLLGGGSVSDLPLQVSVALWRFGLLLTPAERAALPAGAEAGEPEIETAECPCPAWLPPENAGPRLWRRMFPTFASLDGDPIDAPVGLGETGFGPRTPALLPGLLSTDDAAVAATIWRALSAAGLLRWRGGKGFSINNDPLGRALLRRLTPAMERVVGCPLRQSYTYAMFYESGAVLPLHVDRLQCQYTLSLMLDFSQQPVDGACPWPVEVELTPGAPLTQFHQACGDGVLFCGRDLVHGRPRLADGHRALVLMLHWVSCDFPDAEMDRS